MKHLLLLLLPFLASAQTDYTQGVFVVNEDWYGHQNSTLNYLLPEESNEDCWHYRAFQEENDGCQLGATNQFGTIYDGKFYFIAKQDKDPGSSVQGGRITVADAKSLKILYQSPVIDPTGEVCDGRGFVGVNPHKGYISSSNGIWVMDLDNFGITGRIPGTENPNLSGSTEIWDPTGILYSGQTGSMVTCGGKVFAAHQQYGCLVIDAETDQIIKTISISDCLGEEGYIGSVVAAKNNKIYLSCTSDSTGNGFALPYLVEIDPGTLEYKKISVPDGINPPASSWYAWTPDSFCASSKRNCLFWSCSAGRWFASQDIYRYDIDEGKFEKIVDLAQEGNDWKIYGCSMRVHPLTDELYVSLYHDCSSPVYLTRRYTSEGEKIRDYPMVNHYWFPSTPIFPQRAEVSLSEETLLMPEIFFSESTLKLVNCKDENVSIYNLSGEKVKTCVPETPCFSFPLSLPSGIYIIHTSRLNKKLIIN